MTEELYAFDAEYRARAGVVCGVDEAVFLPVWMKRAAARCAARCAWLLLFWTPQLRWTA